MTIYSIFNLVKRYFTYKIIECKNHLGEDCSESEDYLSDDKKELAYVMEFNNFISQEKQNHWSVKLYDKVANIFKS